MKLTKEMKEKKALELFGSHYDDLCMPTKHDVIMALKHKRLPNCFDCLNCGTDNYCIIKKDHVEDDDSCEEFVN